MDHPFGRAARLSLAMLWIAFACSGPEPGASAADGAAGSGHEAADGGGAPDGGAGGADAPAGDAPAPDAGGDGPADGPAPTADALLAVDQAPPPPDECRLDRECPAPPQGAPVAARCARASDGHRRCVLAEVCAAGPHPYESCCFLDEDCTKQPGGHCLPGAHCWPGGPQPPHEGHCAYDACTSDADCTQGPHGLCNQGAPRTCHYGPCTTNADCTRRAGGQCVRVRNDVCDEVDVYCHYPDDACLSGRDCSGDGGPESYWRCLPKADQQGTMCLFDPPKA